MASAPPQRSYGQRGSHASRYQPKRSALRADDASPSPSPSPSSSSSSRDRHPRGAPRSLTASLRGAPPPPPPPPSSSSSAGPSSRGGDARRGPNFVNYLPQDEAVASGLGVEDGGLDAVESQAVVDILNVELSRFLKMKPRDFWKEVASNGALHEFMDSYLQFRNRWYDLPHRGPRGTIAGVLVGEAELSRRVFLVYYRMSSNKEPGSHSGDCLNAKEHAALLQEKKLMDLPKLLDICAIYGHDNNELTRALVTNAVRLQPKLIHDIGAAVSHFLSIVNTMHQRCSSSLEAILSSPLHEDHGRRRGLHVDLLEVLDFINDAVVTLDAFVDAYRPAAIYLSHPTEMSHGSEELLNILARLHDSLMPKLYQGFKHLSSGEKVGTHNTFDTEHTDTVLSLKMLPTRIVKFGWKLLNICYLSDEPLGDDLSMQTTSKIFPAKVEDPVIRGDILVQTLREIHREVSLHPQEIKSHLTFIQGVEKNYGILGWISNLRTKGWIYMDDEQFQYVAELTSLPPQETQKKDLKLPVSSVGEKIQTDEDSVIMESKISQIKDLFPDYGNGFLAACLEVYDHNPEEVIQRILDGALHEDLLSLDMALEQVPPSVVPVIRNDKGKTVLESTFPSRSTKGKEVLLQSESQVGLLPSVLDHSAERKGYSHHPSASSLSHGRYTRKTVDDLPEMEILDSKTAKDSVRDAVLEAQYEDEYDDSFDELGLSVVESGFEAAETSGDRISSLPEKSSSLESESSKGSSRWKSQKQPQFYVKDGKNYSYKVAGSVAVRNVNEAELVNQVQRETIYGLGRGGNLPLGAVKKLMESEEQINEDNDAVDAAGRGHVNSRGSGGRRGGTKHHRKDRAIRKAFAGLTTS